MLAPPAHAEPVEPAGGEGLLMPGSLLERYLAGTFPGENGTPLPGLRLATPLIPEQRVGLARTGRRAREGFLYRAVHLRPEEDWAFLSEYTAGEEWAGVAKDHVPFGGRGRLADVGPADASWPDATRTVGSQVLVYLATPGLWRDGWRLPVPQGAELVAAATYEPEPAATLQPGQAWRDTRALRWAVPAGSVYLLKFGDAGAGAAWARRWNGVALDRGGPAGEEDLLRTAGFGVVLTGVWT
jgi:CRISPR-associated protein Cmr3